MYKKVLVPLDGSDLAECMLSHLKSLVKDGSVGEVTLLNVVSVDIPHWAELESGQFNLTYSENRCSLHPNNILQKLNPA